MAEWKNLPTELTIHISSFLKVSKVFRLREVCKRWDATFSDVALWTSYLKSGGVSCDSLEPRAIRKLALRCDEACRRTRKGGARVVEPPWRSGRGLKSSSTLLAYRGRPLFALTKQEPGADPQVTIWDALAQKPHAEFTVPGLRPHDDSYSLAEVDGELYFVAKLELPSRFVVWNVSSEPPTEFDWQGANWEIDSNHADFTQFTIRKGGAIAWTAPFPALISRGCFPIGAGLGSIRADDLLVGESACYLEVGGVVTRVGRTEMAYRDCRTFFADGVTYTALAGRERELPGKLGLEIYGPEDLETPLVRYTACAYLRGCRLFEVGDQRYLMAQWQRRVCVYHFPRLDDPPDPTTSRAPLMQLSCSTRFGESCIFAVGENHYLAVVNADTSDRPVIQWYDLATKGLVGQTALPSDVLSTKRLEYIKEDGIPYLLIFEKYNQLPSIVDFMGDLPTLETPAPPRFSLHNDPVLAQLAMGPVVGVAIIALLFFGGWATSSHV